MRRLFSPQSLAFVNLLLGLFLWFLFSTDYSLVGTIPDIVFPLAMGMVAIVSLAINKIRATRGRLWITLAHLPALIGSGLYVFAVFVMFIPPFTLGALFAASEIAGETEIQRVMSPDGTKTAYVYFRGVGAYSGGNGRVYVRIRYSMLPFLERDIFYLPASVADEDTTDFVEWRGNDVLYVSETDQEIRVDVIKAEVPLVITFPYHIMRIFAAMVQQTWINRQRTAPVRNVPIYPGIISGDQTYYRKMDNTAFRSFNIKEANIERVVQWYEKELSTSPWTLLKMERYAETTSEGTHIQYCIQARRDLGNEQHMYYWEFMGSENPSNGVHVNIGSPNPITEACRRYIESP